ASLALGRPFDSGELSPAAVISHRLWQSQFEADPGVIGKQVWINKRPFTVVGVAAPGFTGELAFMAIDAWAPLRMLDRISPFPIDLLGRTSRVVDIGARLQPGVTLEQARSALRIFCSSLAERFPDSHRGISCSCDAGSSIRFPVPGLGRGLKMFLAALSMVVGLLLLVACTNVAHLLMVRSTDRQGEIAVRMALGASRARIVRYLLTESLLLGLAGGLGGMLVRLFVLDYLSAFKAPSPIPVTLDVSVDWRVLTFTLGLAAVTGLVFGLLPALRASRLELADILREHTGAWRSGRGRNRTQTLLVGTQVALSLVLVTAAALTLRSLGNALAFDPGFDVSHGVLAKFNLAYGDYSQQETRQFQEEALRRTRALPGVASAGLSLFPPLDYSANNGEVRIPGDEIRPGERH
ncbi:MAG: ABC transporter permease, partial [Desulfobacterales bacterium]|nr:ABC transporter permease [Desulfobacterales bacterium]